MELSVVIPCLNEEKTIGKCIEKAMRKIREKNIKGEVIVVDNGSTDNSVKIAKEMGATVIYEEKRGYGNALRKGIESARGENIIIADGDDTYDLYQVDKFLDELKKGYDLVIGSRFKGKILPGAMSWSHKYIGNPILSAMIRKFFGGNISDTQCGMRGFKKEAYEKLGMQSTGMEFASEMIIHAIKKKMKISELPIIYYPRKGVSKLSGIRDAWRHIRFMLLYSPNYLFLLPALILFLISFLVLVRLLFGPIYLFGRGWDVHVSIFASIAALVGWQILNFWLCAKNYLATIGLEDDKLSKKILNFFTLERSIAIGSFLMLIGLLILAYIIVVWIARKFGAIAEIKTGIIAFTLLGLGLQTIFSAFLIYVTKITYK